MSYYISDTMSISSDPYVPANVRVTMSKTPSDYRANLNNGNEIANRCF